MLDLMMPEMDGFEFLAELRKSENSSATPIVVLTSKDLTVEERSRLNGQVERVLQKGAYSRDALLLEVKNIVALCAKKKPIPVTTVAAPASETGQVNVSGAGQSAVGVKE